jgi:spermidine/putrescine transport system ATP-binding protein
VSAYVAAFVGQQNFFAGTLTGDGSSVSTAYGLLRPAAPITSVKAGGRVRVAVRPEFITIGVDRPDGEANMAEGKVISVSHLGETMQFLVQLGPDMSLIARLPTPSAPELDVDSHVWCSWRPEPLQVFPDDGAIGTEAFAVPLTTAAISSN